MQRGHPTDLSCVHGLRSAVLAAAFCDQHRHEASRRGSTLSASPQTPKVATGGKLARDAPESDDVKDSELGGRCGAVSCAGVSRTARREARDPAYPRHGDASVGYHLAREHAMAGGSMIHVGEPLSILNRQTIPRSKVERWYTYIGEDNEDFYLRHYQDGRRFSTTSDSGHQGARLGSPRDPIRIPKRWASFVLGRVQRRSLLIRDPFSVFSIGWFARRLRFQIVVIIRHPLAVVASLKRLGYAFDFRNLFEQTSLMNERLERFRPAMEKSAGSTDVVEQGSLLWRILYECVVEDLVRFPVRLARHEDVSRRPLQEYAQLYGLLDLPFNDRARRIIERHTNDRNLKEVPIKNPFEIRLDSRANLDNWRRRLDRKEVDRILSATRPLVDRFYPDE
jgi:hypothetical protein